VRTTSICQKGAQRFGRSDGRWAYVLCRTQVRGLIRFDQWSRYALCYGHFMLYVTYCRMDVYEKPTGRSAWLLGLVALRELLMLCHGLGRMVNNLTIPVADMLHH